MPLAHQVEPEPAPDAVRGLVERGAAGGQNKRLRSLKRCVVHAIENDEA